MISAKAVILMVLACCSIGAVRADGPDEPIPSFYQEPGISRTRDYTDQHPSERIDPFTGKLQWHFVDLFIPGNGGLDIKVQRSYNSLNEMWVEATPAGIGWTMHFGRVLRTASRPICYTQNLSAGENPVLEMPDGGRRIMYVAADGVSFLSTDLWKAECNLTGGGGGLNVYSPDGTRYEMTLQGTPVGTSPRPINTYYVSRIVDRNGNWMNLTYALMASGGAAVSGITTSDGRTVTFNYTEMAGLSHVLRSVVEGTPLNPGRTWNYVQVPTPNTLGATNLMEVQRPDGASWKHEYNNGDSTSPGVYSLRRITYPTGGAIDYAYDFVFFAQNISIPRSTVVRQKLADPGGTWTWDYTPASLPIVADANGNFFYSIPPQSAEQSAQSDQTRVTGPEGSRTYYHVGYNSASSGMVFLIGSALGTSSAVQAEAYGFMPIQISNQQNTRPGGTLAFDSETYAPLMTGHSVGRAGESFSKSYGNFDGFGNAQTIVETGTNTRTTNVTYLADVTRWMIRVKKDETITEGSETLAVARTFDPNANMLSERRAGVTTNFTYTPEGDMASRTDARSKTTSYSDYFRGIARSETQPEGVALTRTVSPAGNVTAQTDGELATTGFSYDGLNRITGITHPLGNPVAVVWDTNSRTVTRGAYREVTTFDGFGRQVKAQHTDTQRGETVTQDYEVDALGRRVFASYPNSTLGTFFTFDMLNRPIFVLHEYNRSSGGWTSLRRHTHASYTTQLLNERNFGYVYRYRSYGEPDKRELVGILDPESNLENTTITRNIAGQSTEVKQDGVPRTYGYDSRFYLTSVTEPETGVTTLGRDAVGNMISRQVGASAQTAYTYDDRNRVSAITYPAGTPSVTKTYYKDDKPKSIDNGIARRDYVYNANKNLLNETLTVGARTFATQYAYDPNDALETLTYGSGRAVAYAPDAFGRARQAGAYVTSVAYHPTGEPSTLTYGNGVQTSVGLNGRLWPNSLRIAKTGDVFNMNYGYDAIGNVTSIGDTVDASYSRGMSYDRIDRLTGISGPWGAGSIAYDLRGNITSQNLGALNLSYNYDAVSQRLLSVNGSKAYSLSYDVYGNVSGNGATVFGYNDASHMRCAKCGQPDQILFDYDGAGQRVRVQKGGNDTYFVYGQGGKLLWEETPTLLKEYVYFNGKPVATREQQLP